MYLWCIKGKSPWSFLEISPARPCAFYVMPSHRRKSLDCTCFWSYIQQILAFSHYCRDSVLARIRLTSKKMKTIITKKDWRRREPLSLSHLFFSFSFVFATTLTRLISQSNRTYSRYPPSLHTLYDWWDKSGVMWFLRGQTSDKICQCKKSWSSLFIPKQKIKNFLSWRQ